MLQLFWLPPCISKLNTILSLFQLPSNTISTGNELPEGLILAAQAFGINNGLDFGHIWPAIGETGLSNVSFLNFTNYQRMTAQA